MSKHASHNHGAVTGNDIEYPIYGRCPFYGRAFEPHIISIRGIMGVSLFHGRVVVRSIGRAEKNSLVLRVTPLLLSDWLPDQCGVNLARTRVSLSLSLSLSPAPLSCVRAIAWSELKRTNERMARGRVLSRGLSVCGAQADLSPSPRAFRSRPNCPFPAVNPNGGFPVEGYAPGQHTMAPDGSEGCAGYVPGIARYLSITDTWGKTR